MKKIIFLVFFISFVVPSYCQQYGSFMGIKLGGDINTFIKQISSKGFEYDRQDDIHPDAHYFKGAYLGKYVELLVGITPQSHKVYVVSVLFNQYKVGVVNDYELKRYYKELKTKIKVKFGKPTDEDYTMKEIGGCNTRWANSIGQVLLGYSDINGDRLSIIFSDFKTRKIAKKEENEYL